MTKIRLECRPQTIFAALYDDMPFPVIGPVQEVAFDVGVTALGGPVELAGLVFSGYRKRQQLFEQRWASRAIRARIGEDNTRIEQNMGIALRSLQFLIHGHELLDKIEITALAQMPESDETIQAHISVPVSFPEQQTELHFPLHDTWWAIQAADWSDQHKQEVFSQCYAVDFVKLGPDNQFFAADGLTLEEHYSWNQPVSATAGGKIVYAIDFLPDALPGVPADPQLYANDPRRLLGNAVTISHGNGEYSFYGHLRQGHVAVQQGQMVERGDVIGHVGNSGHSPGPHLHFHLMNGPNPFLDQGLPVRFSRFSAGGQFFDQPMVIPTRMIVTGV